MHNFVSVLLITQQKRCFVTHLKDRVLYRMFYGKLERARGGIHAMLTDHSQPHLLTVGRYEHGIALKHPAACSQNVGAFFGADLSRGNTAKFRTIFPERPHALGANCQLPQCGLKRVEATNLPLQLNFTIHATTPLFSMCVPFIAYFELILQRLLRLSITKNGWRSIRHTSMLCYSPRIILHNIFIE